MASDQLSEGAVRNPEFVAVPGMDRRQVIPSLNLFSDRVKASDEGDATKPTGRGWNFHFPEGRPFVCGPFWRISFSFSGEMNRTPIEGRGLFLFCPIKGDYGRYMTHYVPLCRVCFYGIELAEMGTLLGWQDRHCYVAMQCAYSPSVRRSKGSRDAMAKPQAGIARDRVNHLQVIVTDAERAEIKARAAAASLSVSAYLRAAGMGATFRSAAANHEQVAALAKVNADQGRLGGLLKLWLSERPGQGASAREVRALLDRIGELQGALADAAARL